MKQLFKKQLRKRRHLLYIDRRMSEMSLNSLNIILASSKTGSLSEENIEKLLLNGVLTRKYGKRSSLIRY